MKCRRVKKYFIRLAAAACMIVFLMGCGKTEGAAAGQDVEGQDIEEFPDGDYVSEDGVSDGEGDVSGTDTGSGVVDGGLENGADEPESALNRVDASGAGDAGQSGTREGVLEVPEGGRRLTAEELREYSEWVKGQSVYGFLLSDWQVPTQVDLFEVIYSGAGISHEGTKEQKQAFLDRYGQEEIYTDFLVIDRADMNAFLLEKVGLTYDEMLAKGNTGLEGIYYPELDCFCLEAGDTNYCMFECTDGVINEEGTIVTLCFESDSDWVKKCETRVNIAGGTKAILGNHIVEGDVVNVNVGLSADVPTEMVCLIEKSVFENLHTDADASAVENDYVLGDWSKITKEALQGTWYHHPKDAGDNKEYDVILRLDGDDAIVYYPSVTFYGETRYEWDVVDRSDRGLCPELAIYWRGTHDGELAWYILGISDARDYFWCNGEVFYKQ
ncbi:MAG: hypothetical protein NC416_11825 [Eubacterium sp.]|nr:hypothetical protein [Eubacterium sp.]